MGARLKKDTVISAIKKHDGVISDAAKSLKCSRQTIYNYINKHDDVKEAYEEVNERTIDLVEKEMMKQIKEGNTTLIIFYLKTKAKHRGYVERQEVTGKDGSAVVYKLEYPDDADTNATD